MERQLLNKIYLSLSLLFVMGSIQCSPHAGQKKSEADIASGIIGGEKVLNRDQTARQAVSLITYTYKVNTDSRTNEEWPMLPDLQDRCTASLIHPKILLTAAHCLPSKNQISSHAIFILPNGKKAHRFVKNYRIHPEYVPPENNKIKTNLLDLALLKLESDAPVTAEILELPKADFINDFSEVLATGYGISTGLENTSDDYGVLRKVTLQVMADTLDKANFRVDFTEGKSFCSGDSGGPAIVKRENKFYVVGVASTAARKKRTAMVYPRCSFFGEYVSTFLASDWIEDTMEELLNDNTRADEYVSKPWNPLRENVSP